MTYSKAVPRLALWKVALSLGAAVAVSLAFTGAASADVITIGQDDGNGTNNLGQAIATANTNSSASNTIVLGKGLYSPPAPLTITKNLTITEDHSGAAQAGASYINISGSEQASNNPGNMFTINPGITLTLQGVAITSGGGVGFSVIDDQGNLVTYGVAFSGAVAAVVNVDGASATATLNESSIGASSGDGIDSTGTLTTNNVDVVRGTAVGVSAQSGSLTMNNTLIAENHSGANGPLDDCVNGIPTSGTGSMDDDGSCQVQYSNTTSVDSGFPTLAKAFGGPTTTWKLPTTSPTIGHGVAPCPITDQRFYVDPTALGVPTCDVGSYTNAATQETAALAGSTPNTGALTCVVTGGSGGPPPSQQVTVADTLSGLGPESGAGSDLQPGTGGVPNPGSTTAASSQTLPTSTLNVASTTGFPTSGTLAVTISGTVAATPGSAVVYVTYTGTTGTSFTGVSGGSGTVAAGAAVTGVNTSGIGAPVTPNTPNPADAITNLFISNGTVAFTPFTQPSNSGLVLTATKTNAGLTHWNFTATDWAGISKPCN